MIPDIEKKIRALNPEGQRAVLAFVDFLLSRQNVQDRGESVQISSQREFSGLSSIDSCTEPVFSEDHSHQSNCRAESDDSEIILADECEIGEEDRIDFADINSRFPSEKKTKDSEKNKEPMMFDWL